VALINGPAIGIGVTVLGMFDLVYASDKATFMTPFGRLSLVPEACSTYTFPRLMGHTRAMEVLLFNRKLSADVAHQYGLVTDVFPHARFASETAARLAEYSELPQANIIQSRKVIRDQVRKQLHHACEMECKLADERRKNPQDTMEAVMKFFSSRSKM